jgi:hypothetical protein
MGEGLKLTGLNWPAPQLRRLLQKVSPDELLPGKLGLKSSGHEKVFQLRFCPKEALDKPSHSEGSTDGVQALS